ncbi:MAG: hypothetical protein M1587_06570, partial [Thaumarchaeota archaeon]|nr:hypothetical protein [Nitrososphaerota archaeon]
RLRPSLSKNSSARPDCLSSLVTVTFLASPWIMGDHVRVTRLVSSERYERSQEFRGRSRTNAADNKL